MNICSATGLKIPDNFLLTPKNVAELLEKQHPEMWRRVYTKHIEAPGNYTGFRQPAVGMCLAALQQNKSLAAAGIMCASAVLREYDYPLYFVAPNLLRALNAVCPPSLTWGEIELPFDGLMFALPNGAIIEKRMEGHGEGQPITHLGFARLRLEREKEYRTILNGPVKIHRNGDSGDKIIIFWCVEGGTVLQALLFASSHQLKLSPRWVQHQRAENEQIEVIDRDTAITDDFMSEISGLVANLILLMMARPELREAGGKTGRILKSRNLPIYAPSFLGRKYEIINRSREKAPTGAHFTLLKWRAGHWRAQHYGPRNDKTKQRIAQILIDPYIAYSAGLVYPAMGEEKKQADVILPLQ